MLSHSLTTTVTPLHPLKYKGGVITMAFYAVTLRNACKGVTLVLWHSWAQYMERVMPLYTEQRHEVPADVAKCLLAINNGGDHE